MEFQEETLGDITILKLTGRLDASSAASFKDKIKSLVKGNRLKIVADLEGAGFMDSSGLGSLVAALRSINKAGGDIKISSLNDQCRTIFELTRLHYVFEIFDDSHSAAKAFA